MSREMGADGHLGLSVVLPAYRAARQLEAHLPTLRRYLDGLALAGDYEVIVVDDGSDDGGWTQRVAERLGCRYVANPTNQGKGAAVRRGMRAARGAVRVYTDADVPYALDTIERMVTRLGGECEVAIGDRTLGAASYFREVSVARSAASRAYTRVVGWSIGRALRDTQCGIKGFQATVADNLFAVGRIDGYAFDVELLAVALERGYAVCRLPVELRVAQDESSVNLVSDGLRMLRDLVRIRWYRWRGGYGGARR